MVFWKTTKEERAQYRRENPLSLDNEFLDFFLPVPRTLAHIPSKESTIFWGFFWPPFVIANINACNGKPLLHDKFRMLRWSLIGPFLSLYIRKELRFRSRMHCRKEEYLAAIMQQRAFDLDALESGTFEKNVLK